MKRTTIVTGLTLLAASQMPGAVSAQVTVEAEIAEAVTDMMPQNPGTDFPAEVGSVVCWTRVTGAEGTEITHTWIHGEMEFPVTLAVSGSPWRTWSRKAIPPEWAGEWRVEIRDAEGNLLDTRSFTVGG